MIECSDHAFMTLQRVLLWKIGHANGRIISIFTDDLILVFPFQTKKKKSKFSWARWIYMIMDCIMYIQGCPRAYIAYRHLMTIKTHFYSAFASARSILFRLGVCVCKMAERRRHESHIEADIVVLFALSSRNRTLKQQPLTHIRRCYPHKQIYIVLMPSICHSWMRRKLFTRLVSLLWIWLNTRGTYESQQFGACYSLNISSSANNHRLRRNATAVTL